VNGLEVNTEKCKYVVMFWEQHAGQNYKIKIDNKWFERWNSSDIWEQPEQIKLQSMQNLGTGQRKECLLLFSAEFCPFQLAVQKLKPKIIRTVILLVIMYGCQILLSHWGRNIGWQCLILWYLGRYLGLSGTKWQGSGETYIMRSLTICTPHQILGRSNRE